MGDGEPRWWVEHAVHLVLLAVAVALVALRVAGVVHLPWWALLWPVWFFVAAYVGTYVALRTLGPDHVKADAVEGKPAPRVMDEDGFVDVEATMKVERRDLSRQMLFLPFPGRRHLLQMMRADLEQLREDQIAQRREQGQPPPDVSLT